MTTPPIMAPCPGCRVDLPTVLVACTDCLATLPDALRERWAQVDGRHRENLTAYLDARHEVRAWFKRQAEDRRLDEAHRAIGAVR